MPDKINEHAFVAGVCTHCGAGEPTQRSCVWREAPPRAVPASIFAGDISRIGERAKEIRAEEDKALAGSSAAATEA